MIAWLRNNAPYEGWRTFLLGAVAWLCFTFAAVPLLVLLVQFVRSLP